MQVNLIRLFSAEAYKGTKHYLNEQKKYEIARTILYFAISLAILILGIAVTKTRRNLLTVVAVLGCLPACKSAVGMIMFLRFRSCSEYAVKQITSHIGSLNGLYDMVFTSYDKNYAVAHLTVKGKTICGYTEDQAFDEQGFVKHLDGILKTDGYKDVTVKIFRDLTKYTDRLEQMKLLEADEKTNEGILSTLKNVTL